MIKVALDPCLAPAQLFLSLKLRQTFAVLCVELLVVRSVLPPTPTDLETVSYQIVPAKAYSMLTQNGGNLLSSDA